MSPSATNGTSAPFTPSSQRPSNVGIHGIETYFPPRCISEEELEKFDGVPAGKYTIGLGAEYMAFTDDREDIHSFLLTVTDSLLKKYNIDPRQIGRLDVGTETIIDKSKAAKTILMDLFAESGNFDIDGIDSKNACYGGTAALFNAVNWVESSSWDGRYALVVAGDIAIYAEGAARPVGGAGAVAMLIGPDAPIVIDPLHSTYMSNSWDFYKPQLDSEYPEVDGPLTVSAYFSALDAVYELYKKKHDQAKQTNVSTNTFDYVAFHGPYGKQVQKAAARLCYLDFCQNPDAPEFANVDKSFSELPRSKTYGNKDLEKTFGAVSKEFYQNKVVPTTAVVKRLGNTYSASLYGAICSLFALTDPATLKGKKLGCFSYGSGLASSFFSLDVVGDTSAIHKALNLKQRFDSMHVVPPQEFVDALHLREDKNNKPAYKPDGKTDIFAPGTYYLEECDSKYRRTYTKVQ